MALLAISTTLGVSHLFHLLTFFYHQRRANGRPSDGLFRQQQALLRKLPTPSDLMADSLKLWWSWRKISERPLLRAVFPASLALLFAVASLAASLFSSFAVLSTNIQVRIASPLCAGINTNSSVSLNNYINRVLTSASTYADDCYKNTTSLPARCNIFTKPNIPFITETTACPFSSDICLSPAISFDSGRQDLNHAFGFNLADKDRVKYRRRTTCAILSQEGHMKVMNVSDTPQALWGRPAYPNEKANLYYYNMPREEDTAQMTWALSLLSASLFREYGVM